MITPVAETTEPKQIQIEGATLLSTQESEQKACTREVVDKIIPQQMQTLNPETMRGKDIIDAAQITRNVYLGSYQGAARCLEAMKLLGITHNLMIGNTEFMPIPFPNDFTYKFIELDDDNTAKIEKHFDECIRWIEDALHAPSSKTGSEPSGFHQYNKVLINCWAGVSRSTSVVIAYLMKRLCYNYLESFESVRKARNWIAPNVGFRNQLIDFSRKIGRSVSESAIQQYDQAWFLLNKMYGEKSSEEEGLNMTERMTVLECFYSVFGPYHIHTLDVQEELQLNVEPSE